MATTYICRHCKERYIKNTRLKKGQRYCGSNACQQERKNKWERERSRSDKSYRTRRQASKSNWYNTHQGYIYQRDYRSSHPEYVISNRQKQHFRNHKPTESAIPCQIVKTDALISNLLANSDFHVILPVKNASVKKDCKDGRVNCLTCGHSAQYSDITERFSVIVKTDAIATGHDYG